MSNSNIDNDLDKIDSLLKKAKSKKYRSLMMI
ncbi:hypothetical protein RAT170B_0960 [Rickettsia argasii T170-B]|uniref:Uncharacterized protein n=1 Tax=Rickettsia argasii T170-B TaxID=1268837 RepID=A0A0F3REH4_9RICK|nr:hypothetical protein RAT170B_0960 [Rickettsia argasii T170-B]